VALGVGVFGDGMLDDDARLVEDGIARSHGALDEAAQHPHWIR
jgi:hypothetical protein